MPVSDVIPRRLLGGPGRCARPSCPFRRVSYVVACDLDSAFEANLDSR